MHVRTSSSTATRRIKAGSRRQLNVDFASTSRGSRALPTTRGMYTYSRTRGTVDVKVCFRVPSKVGLAGPAREGAQLKPWSVSECLYFSIGPQIVLPITRARNNPSSGPARAADTAAPGRHAADTGLPRARAAVARFYGRASARRRPRCC